MTTAEPPDLLAAPYGAEAAGWFDSSTQLPGPTFWDAILTTEAARWVRYRRPATIVLAEIVGLDEFSRVWGVGAAQRRAVSVGRTLRSGCRTSDYLARLDEACFAVLLTETGEIAAINMVERVRAACEGTPRGVTGDTWVAFGWASPTVHRSLFEAARLADDRLRREAARGMPG